MVEIVNDLHIEQFETNYRMPAAALDQRSRLDRVVNDMFESYLDVALERAGVSPHDEICIREIRVPIRLRLSATDHSIALAWAMALAEAIRDAIADGESNWIVRYESRRHALLDFATSVATGRTNRSWVWRQLGFGDVDESSSRRTAAQNLATALTDTPSAIVPIIRAVAEQGQLYSLSQQFKTEDWKRLALAAISQLSSNAAQIFDAVLPSHAERPRPRIDIDRIIVRSQVFRAARQLSVAEDVRFLLGVLSLVEVEPAIFQRPLDELRASVARVALLLETRAMLTKLDTNPDTISEQTTHSTANERIPSRDNAKSTNDLKSQANDKSGGTTDRAGRERTDSRNDDRGIESSAEAILDDGSPTTDEETVTSSIRSRGWTDQGGLLFFISVIDENKFVPELLAAELGQRRSLRWWLHQLAMNLSDVRDADAAALAFAGLGPDDEPPSSDEPPATSQEQTALAKLCQRVVSITRERLARAEPSDRFDQRNMSDDQLVDWLCRRRANILADAGWIELHFSLNDVSTEIRRAGLDLDPGFVPWLGVVVKYFYE